MPKRKHLCKYIEGISVCQEACWKNQDGACEYSSKSLYRDACMWFYDGRCGNPDANIDARIHE